MSLQYIYKIDKVDIRHKLIIVTYSRQNYPDVHQTFSTSDFSHETVLSLINQRATRVLEYWNFIDKSPTIGITENETGVLNVPPKQVERPAYNTIFQKLEETTEIIDGKLYQKWNIVNFSEPEVIENLISAFQKTIDSRLNDFVRSRGYDNIVSACTYLNSSITKYAIEAQRCIDLRSNIWNIGTKILDDIKTKKRPIPSSIEEIEKELPQLTWED